ncbi:helix-turn-helix domain-containing protein [Lederbergia wuyishanensis]|uniref:MerR family transcriptional activator of bmr protein n=1 Tax=Lederbergia wuyishanensis TaxID=1347903 RepID=A0ABU0D684_9BACI|nr:MerR family transcriptional regulator [Lederbergia wuyishanensis]MCJ8008671.1 MerR family transcriptional regulator [Lederbergia wuyishanensis]MDQ0343910.1 MerR family transcriptional activator of bmr gene [Lederbergia wuyishanensis]
MEEKLYTIGEVSKLANISIKALRYYDKIDLFKPVYVDPHTNFRYYKDSQIYLLDLIKSLKYIGTSLDDIKKVQELKTDEFFSFLTEQEKIVRKKINNLLEIEQIIANAKMGIQRQKEYPILGEVFLSEEKESNIIQIKTSGNGPKTTLYASYSKLRSFAASTEGFRNSGYGAIFPYKPYTHIDEVTYHYLFTPVLTNRQTALLPQNTEIATIPQGTYVCIRFNSLSFEEYFLNLQKLIQYVARHKLKVMSDIYETLVHIHYSPKQQEEFLMEMRILVKETL